MKETVSTLSNAAYIVVGIMVLPVYYPAGVSLMILGLASAWYHYAKTSVSQHTDVSAIFLTLNACIAYLLSFYGIPEHVLLSSIVAVSIFTTYVVFAKDIRSYTLIPVQFVIIVLLAADTGNTMQFVSAFVLGLVFNIPYLLFPGTRFEDYKDITHSVWHVLTAIGFYYLLT